MPLSLTFAAQSHVGLVRKNNQDSGYASPTTLLVADGMGGAAAGDLASAIAVREIRDDDRSATGGEMLDDFVSTLRRTNGIISDLIASQPRLEGMGTTITGLKFDGEQYGLINLGDSRTYLLRDGKLTRLTHDHSFVQSLIDEGQITEEEAHHHPNRSLILKVLNGLNIYEPDLSLVEARAGDRILVCSDGLCGFVEDGPISQLLAEPDINTCVSGLMRMALAAGGYDNITIVVGDVGSGPGTTTPQVVGAAAELEIPEIDEATRPIQVTPRPDPQADEIARYRPQTKRGVLRPVMIGVLAVVLVALVGAGGLFGYVSLNTKHYIAPYPAANGEPLLGIYEGIPDSPFGQWTWTLVDPADPNTPGTSPQVRMTELTRTDRKPFESPGHVEVKDIETGLKEIQMMKKRFEQCLAEKEKGKDQKPKEPKTPTVTTVPQPTHVSVPPTTHPPTPSGAPSGPLSPSPSAPETPAPEPEC